MKKVLVLLSMAVVAQGSLLLGVENLKFLSPGPLREKCTGLWNRHVSNTLIQNEACDDLNNLYYFFKKESEVAEWIGHSKKNGTFNKISVSAAIEDRFKKNTDTLDFDFELKSWRAIDAIFPEATETSKRCAQYQLRCLKHDLATKQRNRELDLLIVKK